MTISFYEPCELRIISGFQQKKIKLKSIKKVEKGETMEVFSIYNGMIHINADEKVLNVSRFNYKKI